MTYKVIEHPDFEFFQEMVEDAREAGWKLAGGINTYLEDVRFQASIIHYLQAVYKNENN